MPNIIFKEDISNNILFDFLKINSIYENEHFIINKLVFKKYEYNNLIPEFYNSIKNNYKNSKKYYLERHITYNNFLTIIRQICKCNKISYYSKIKYDKNNYNIVYYIKNEIIL